ncbi:TRAP transporter small permease [Falsirhodobacter algicola]|uniref:TRAP transporter small permease protein n=1 Tax=Falsirhodobacter algicola TaxID=2692330 RepID=A0A8J8SMA6_9RHOB|nr:TRAP transporter small permease [Falsirhodobacter algicola]QUS37244.1 TRAP transporter small permease subunit [Falsirhodobacter algicola]
MLNTHILPTVNRALFIVRLLCMVLASLALAVLIVSFGWLVFGRYVLNATPTWVEQLALLLICYITFLGAAAGVHEDSHIGVTMFRDLLPEPLRKIAFIAVDLALAAFGAVMLIAGITLMRFGWDTMLPMLGVPESTRTLAITSCGGLILLFAGLRALSRCLSFKDWSPEPEFKDI